MPPQTPIVIHTLGDFLANPGHTLTATCPKCQHSEPFDGRRLVDRYGGDAVRFGVSTIAYKPRA